MSHLLQQIRQAGITYETYLARWREQLDRPLAGLDKDQRKYQHYARYNLERSAQVQERYEVSEKLQASLAAAEPQVWMILSEPFCADSAYAMPVLVAAASAGKIELVVVLRDEHPEIMDRYLTGGTRSIPKLVAFSPEGEELFQWGPRPAEAVALRDTLKSSGEDAARIGAALIEWYEQGGFLQVDQELAEAIEAVAAAL